MPLYTYDCEDCGPFSDWQSMSRATDPVACPICDELAPRTISAPFLANMDPNNRIAHQRNEKSAHEPQTATRKQLDRQGAKRGHGHHHHGHKHHASRPWMIGH